MTDPDTDRMPQPLADLPIVPTGSGVTDLTIAYEQMRLAAEGHGAEQPNSAGLEDDTVDGVATQRPAPVPTEDGADAAESAAHPS